MQLQKGLVSTNNINNMEKVSFCIGTGENERPYLELLFHSMKENFVRKDHEIIVFVDKEDQLNSIDFLKSQRSIFPNLKIIKNPLPVVFGYQSNINYMSRIAKNDVVCVLHSDMVVMPNYDEDIQLHLKPRSIVSSTRIEPPLHPASVEKFTQDFGVLPEHLLNDPKRFQSLCKFANENKDPTKITPYFFAPLTFYKDDWNRIGGHDTQFRRSREDSDILWRFQLDGARIIQSWVPMVYHFTCTSSRGVKWWEGGQEQDIKNKLQSQADQIEIRKFMRKWGVFKHPVTPEDADHWRYQIGANITNVKNTEEHVAILLQMFFLFDKIYIDNPDALTFVMEKFYGIHIPANTLFRYTREIWEAHKGIFNVLEANQIYRSTPITDRDVIVDIDLPSFLQNKETQNTLAQINDILHDSLEEGDSGDFEVNGINVHVKELKNRIRENIYVHNPKLGDGLIEI